MFIKISYAVSILVNLGIGVGNLVTGENLNFIAIGVPIILGLIQLKLLFGKKNISGHISIFSFLALLVIFAFFMLMPHAGPGALGLAVILMFVGVIAYIVSIAFGVAGIVAQRKPTV